MQFYTVDILPLYYSNDDTELGYTNKPVKLLVQTAPTHVSTKRIIRRD
jgi:hypothetical protein